MIKVLATIAAVSVLALPAAAHAQTTTHPDSAQRAARAERREEAREAAGKKEAHPEIRAAIRSLERAKAALEHASHDFGGHRADALRSVDESIKQLRLAMQYDTK